MPVNFSDLKIRTLFISDLHLGFRLANADASLSMLQRVQPETVYLVGDTIDHWRLKHRWHWPEKHEAVLQQIAKMKREGVQFFVCPGNHDDCLRNEEFKQTINSQDRLDRIFDVIRELEISETFVHETLGGRRMLVTHGDLFDDVHRRTGGISRIGSKVFDIGSWMLPKNAVHALRRFFKWIMARPNRIEESIVESARSRKLDGVIYGHLHKPSLQAVDEFVIANTGDWVENESFLAELTDGSLILVNRNEQNAAYNPTDK